MTRTAATACAPRCWSIRTCRPPRMRRSWTSRTWWASRSTTPTRGGPSPWRRASASRMERGARPRLDYHAALGTFAVVGRSGQSGGNPPQLPALSERAAHPGPRRARLSRPRHRGRHRRVARTDQRLVRFFGHMRGGAAGGDSARARTAAPHVRLRLPGDPPARAGAHVGRRILLADHRRAPLAREPQRPARAGGAGEPARAAAGPTRST